MKPSFWKDFFLIFLLVIADEILHEMFRDVYSPPRSAGQTAGFVTDVVLSALTVGIFYLRSRPAKYGILYGILIGLLLLLPIHLIQYPTSQNWYIVGYKLVVAILLAHIFTRYLNKFRKK